MQDSASNASHLESPPLTEGEIGELRRLLEKATPKDWFIVPYGDGDSLVVHSSDEMRVFFPPIPVGYSATPGSHGDPAQIKADMDLIAAARNLLPSLLAEVERGRKALEPPVLSDDRKADADKVAGRIRGMLAGWPPGVAYAAMHTLVAEMAALPMPPKGGEK